MVIFLLVLLLSLIIFYAILQTDFSGIVKFFLVVIEMILVSQFLVRRYKLPTEMGFILLKSDKGIGLIDKFSRMREGWQFFSDVGSTLSYGLLSLFIMRRNTSWKSVLVGLMLLCVISMVIAPFSIIFLKKVLVGATMLEKNGAFNSIGTENIALLSFVLMLLGGFFAVLLLSIVYYGLFVFAQIILFLLGSANTLSATTPGGTLLLPGVNLPFLEGLIAILVIMVAHEGSHAILARIAKVPIRSSGVVLFGIIPVGAFVEPDEKILERKDATSQTRVLVAGSTANFISSVIFFLLFAITVLILKSGLVGTSADFGYQLFHFIYITTGLVFSLNFVVATVNLLPLPFFDGYRILEINIQNKNIVKAVMLITLGAFILNFLPHFFSAI